MGNTPRLPSHTRFFARVLAADLECPHCGTTLRFGRRYQRRSCEWDPKRARLLCMRCQRSFVIGLLAWSPPLGSAHPQLPADHVPNGRQLAELRQLAGGMWLEPHRGTKKEEETNLYGPCTCGDRLYPEERDRYCPIHGEEWSQDE